LAGIAALWWMGLDGLENPLLSTSKFRTCLRWTVWACSLLIVVATSRAAGLSIVVALATIAVFRPTRAARQVIPMGVAAAVVTAALACAAVAGSSFRS